MPIRSVAFRDLTVSDLALWSEVLAQKQKFPSPFLTHEFCGAVNDAAGEVFVASLGHGANRAFLPFQRRAYMPLVGDKVGRHMSDVCGIVGISDGYDERSILSAADLSVFCFDHWLQPGCPISFDRVVESPGIRVGVESAATYFSDLQASDRKFFNEVNRLEAQLIEKCGNLRFEWHSLNGQAELERLIAAKRKQYFQSNAADALSSAWSRNLLKMLLTTRSNDFEAIMSTIHCGDDWVASHFGLRYRDVLHIWFPVYNEEFRRFGPGHILLFKILAHGCSIGIKVFDFGMGVSSYKKKYAGTEYLLAKGSLRKASPIALAHRIAQSLKWRFQQ